MPTASAADAAKQSRSILFRPLADATGANPTEEPAFQGR